MGADAQGSKLKFSKALTVIGERKTPASPVPEFEVPLTMRPALCYEPLDLTILLAIRLRIQRNGILRN